MVKPSVEVDQGVSKMKQVVDTCAYSLPFGPTNRPSALAMREPCTAPIGPPLKYRPARLALDRQAGQRPAVLCGILLGTRPDDSCI